MISFFLMVFILAYIAPILRGSFCIYRKGFVTSVSALGYGLVALNPYFHETQILNVLSYPSLWLFPLSMANDYQLDSLLLTIVYKLVILVFSQL